MLCKKRIVLITLHWFLQKITYFTNSIQNNTSKQGTVIFIKSDIPHKVINIDTEYQLVTIEINLNIKFTILSFYIPPSEDISVRELTNIIYPFNTPVLVVGDFFGCNTIWGSTYNNRRGKLLASIILDTGLCVLNDKSPTHLSTHNTFSHIDLSLCSMSLLHLVYWKTRERPLSNKNFYKNLAWKLLYSKYKAIFSCSTIRVN